jgi:alkane 1-monooxygenase
MTSISNKKAVSPIQWRFVLLFSILISPMIVWPLVIHSNMGDWSSLVFWLPLIAVHGLIPLLDLMLGRDKYPAIAGETPIFNKLLPMLCLPAWFGVILSACHVVSVGAVSPVEFSAIVLSLGSLGAVLAINPAHELIHRNTPLERNIGGLLLAGVCYGAFKVEHVRGHHLNAATDKDTASAKKGDNTFSFTVRSMLGTVWNAHHLEYQRLKRISITPSSIQWWLKNEVIRWNAISVIFAIVITLAFGWLALAVFLLASLGAIFELEVINFIEHYGLRRQAIDGTQKLEPVQEHHSWNTNTLASNMFLFNLQRHSDHHAHAGKDYLHLSSIESAPQMPYGYSVMFLAALCPPVWRKLMDHRIPSVRSELRS